MIDTQTRYIWQRSILYNC